MDPASGETRRDPLWGEWVRIAPARDGRPRTWVLPEPVPSGDGCPFCPGAESETPPAVAVDRDGDRWRVRAVPNRYPAIEPPSGWHEVIIETDRHDARWSTFTDDEWRRSLAMARARWRAIAAGQDVEHLQLFKNEGAWAGATLAHPHLQLIALPEVPPRVARWDAAQRKHHQQTGRCLLCEERDRAVADDRVVAAFPGWHVITPWAPRFAYQLWLVPDHVAHAGERRWDETLAPVLADALFRIDALVGPVPLNAGWMSLAPGRSDPAIHHWYVDVRPRLGQEAGFEWTTGVAINSVPPEVAAVQLRRMR